MCVFSPAATNNLTLNPNSLLAVSCAAVIGASHLISHPLFLYLTSTHLHTKGPIDSLRDTRVPTTVDIIPKPCVHPVESSTVDGSDMILKDIFDSRNMEKIIGTSKISSPNGKKYMIPIPMVAVLGRGLGKLRMREFCLSPLPETPLPQQMKMLKNIYVELGKLLSTKQGVGG